MNPIDRLKVLINSSTPIVVMETVEEVRALTLVHSACSELNLAVFEWSIADGLIRSQMIRSGGVAQPPALQPRLGALPQAVQTALYAAFARKQELSNGDLLTALSSTVPLSITRAEEITELRAWAKDRAVWASPPAAWRENA